MLAGGRTMIRTTWVLALALLVSSAGASPPAEPAASADRIVELERENAELRNRISALNGKFVEIVCQFTGAYFGPTPGLIVQPQIDGHVLDVKHDLKLVV